jgi:hypothetical protein
VPGLTPSLSPPLVSRNLSRLVTSSSSSSSSRFPALELRSSIAATLSRVSSLPKHCLVLQHTILGEQREEDAKLKAKKISRCSSPSLTHRNLESPGRMPRRSQRSIDIGHSISALEIETQHISCAKYAVFSSFMNCCENVCLLHYV